MPIIFAQALMFLPMTIGQYLSKSNPDWATNAFFRSMSDFTSVPYNVVYFFLVVIFTYVYTALIVNPQQYSEYLKRQNAFIPGIKPGAHTAEFIDTVTTRITLPGSIFLASIAILPAFSGILNIGSDFAMKSELVFIALRYRLEYTKSPNPRFNFLKPSYFATPKKLSE